MGRISTENSMGGNPEVMTEVGRYSLRRMPFQVHLGFSEASNDLFYFRAFVISSGAVAGMYPQAGWGGYVPNFTMRWLEATFMGCEHRAVTLFLTGVKNSTDESVGGIPTATILRRHLRP
jgi:hypothetical protein